MQVSPRITEAAVEQEPTCVLDWPKGRASAWSGMAGSGRAGSGT
jgi:hypothetical protein